MTKNEYLEKLPQEINKQCAYSALTSPAAETAACGEAFTSIHSETINGSVRADFAV